jgi:hypothetical protein
MVEVGNHHFEQVVSFAGKHAAGNDLGESDDSLLEFDRRPVRMAFDFHAYKDGKAKTDVLAAQYRPITRDVSVALEVKLP